LGGFFFLECCEAERSLVAVMKQRQVLSGLVENVIITAYFSAGSLI